MIAYYNLTGYQGDYIQYYLRLKDQNGNPINLSGYNVRGQARASYGSSGVLLNLNPNITNYESGLFNIHINSYISKEIPVGEFVYDIEKFPYDNPTGDSCKIIRGKFCILPEVTR